MRRLAWLLLAIPLAPRGSSEVVFSPNGGCQKRIVSEFGAAKTQIDAAIFCFTAQPVADALVEARKKNDRLDVRVLVDYYQHVNTPAMRDLVKALKAAGVKVKRVDLGDGDRKKDQPHFHHKFAVIDGETVVTGSYNWTDQAESRNCENLLVLKNDQKTAKAYVKEFERLWESKEAKDVPE